MRKTIAFQILILFIGAMVFTPAMSVRMECTDHQQGTAIYHSQVEYEPAAGTDKAKKNDPYVYITKTGKKYHNKSCRYLDKSRIRIKLSEAKRKGYKACLKCKPPK